MEVEVFDQHESNTGSWRLEEGNNKGILGGLEQKIHKVIEHKMNPGMIAEVARMENDGTGEETQM